MDTRASLKETLHRFSLMPSCPINIKPNHITAQTPVEMSQDLNKPFPISPFRANHSVASQKRRHPTRNIKPLVMLAGGRDAKRMSSLGPPPSQPGMQGKTRFILKNHRLPRTQILKFFLTRGETASLLPPGPEDTNNWPVSSDIPADASTSGPAAPSVSTRTDVLSARPRWGHPTGPGSGQIPEAIALSAVPPLARSGESAETASLVWACSSKLSTPRHSRSLSSDSSSCASDPRPWLSSPAAVLRRLKAGLQSLIPSTPPGYSWQKLPGCPGSPPDAGYRSVPYSQFNINQPNM